MLFGLFVLHIICDNQFSPWLHILFSSKFNYSIDNKPVRNDHYYNTKYLLIDFRHHQVVTELLKYGNCPTNQFVTLGIVFLRVILLHGVLLYAEYPGNRELGDFLQCLTKMKLIFTKEIHGQRSSLLRILILDHK